MRRKLLLFGLSLILVLVSMMPATAVLAKPATQVVASGYVAGIDLTTEENVVPIGDWGWRVTNRSLVGTLLGPEISDDFIFTYNAIVDLTQKGSLYGTLSTSEYTLSVYGKSDSYYFIGWFLEPGLSPDYPYGIPILGLDVHGSWVATSGATGGGQFAASLTFIPSADGAHIEVIDPYNSPITLTGKFTPIKHNWWWWWSWLWGRHRR
jgi:hypothetical protein